ncbi:polycomb group protein Psc [Patella vulgata]|uniref:polycomb group protein Psc n=1 Tax=Patella vulgata TaxID=6465 RepID=UPI0024A83FCD|nr:polycomb group protein Psc [Patella vulgata]
MCTMHRSKKINIGDVNPHLLCVLCGGYFVEATTIIECLHSFCKTCLIRYLETNKTCPMCDVLIHKTRPHQNIRSDKTLQDIVYKLVPGLYKNEMKRRRDFYSQYPNKGNVKTPSEDRGDEMAERFIFTENEKISLALEYWTEGIPDSPEFQKVSKKEMGGEDGKTQKRDIRYLQCPGALTVAHLKKFIRLKFELPHRCRIDMYHKKEIVSDYYTLLDIACIFSWKRLEPLRLYYTIYENIITKRKIGELETNSVDVDEPKPKTVATKDTAPKIPTGEVRKPTETVGISSEHKFLTPKSTKEWNTQSNKSANQQAPVLEPLKSSNQQASIKDLTKINNKQPTNTDSYKTADTQTPIRESPKPTQNQSEKTVSTVPQISKVSNSYIKASAQNAAKAAPTKRANQQPTKIAPKVSNNQQAGKETNQQTELKSQPNPQSSKIIVTEKSANPQTVRMLVNNKAAINQMMNVHQTNMPNYPSPRTQNTQTTQTKQQNQAQLTTSQQSTNNNNNKKTVLTNPNSPTIQSIKSCQSQVSKQTKPTVNTMTVSSPNVNGSNDNVVKQNGGEMTKSNAPVYKALSKDLNGIKRGSAFDMKTIPDGAVIRSVRPPFNTSQSIERQNSATKNTLMDNSLKKTVDTPVVEKQNKNTADVKKSEPKVNGDPTPTIPKINGTQQQSTQINDGTRPQTLKVNGGSRPSTPKLNNGSRPSTPKLPGNSRPSTPKLNGSSRPPTPKANGGSRPSTPKLNGDVRSFKPIAPKLPGPNVGQTEIPKSVNGDQQAPLNYSKVQPEKRAFPIVDASSSDICEEIRQRKLARMDEPLNLSKRDQDKNKPVSPINGNVSPRNNLQMVVGSAGI